MSRCTARTRVAKSSKRRGPGPAACDSLPILHGHASVRPFCPSCSNFSDDALARAGTTLSPLPLPPGLRHIQVYVIPELARVTPLSPPCRGDTSPRALGYGGGAGSLRTAGPPSMESATRSGAPPRRNRRGRPGRARAKHLFRQKLRDAESFPDDLRFPRSDRSGRAHGRVAVGSVDTLWRGLYSKHPDRERVDGETDSNAAGKRYRGRAEPCGRGGRCRISQTGPIPGV